MEDKDLLIVVPEVGSVIYNNLDTDKHKNLSCVIRQDPETLSSARGESLIVCAALLEKDSNHEFVVNKVFGLNSVQKRWKFLRLYTQLFLAAMIPPIYKYGISFEAHPQNTLTRFRKVNNNNTENEYQLVGFMIRDYGGIVYNREKLMKPTGIHVEYNPRRLRCSINSLHDEAFHSIIQSNLYRFVRALGFYYCGVGIRLVRDILSNMLPLECPTREYRLNSITVKRKAFLNMKFSNVEFDPLYTSIPNLLTLVSDTQGYDDFDC